jgi:alkylation response protein AidB-like acyl-CoA dehydrogenase
VQERKPFGRAIAEFQGLQFMLDDLTFFSSAAKCLASDVAMSVTTDAVQLLGGYGYMNDYPVERMMRDAKITLAAPGMRNPICRERA